MTADSGGSADVLGVILRTLAGARLQLKIAALVVVSVGPLVVFWRAMSVDITAARNQSDLIVAALAMAGAAAIGLVFTLYRAGEEAATGRKTPEDWDANPTAFHGMLLVIPTGAAVAGALLAATGGVLVERMVTTDVTVAPILTIPILFGAWSISMVMSSSRFLFRFAQEQTDRAERAQSAAVQAQLTALQAQMNPHFLFNTLNTVAALVRTDAPRAETTVENLASVLRRTLDRSRHVRTSCGEEVDYVRDYVEIERERFGDRLAVDFSVDEAIRSAELPTMTLQPLVENAIKHGVASRIAGGRIEVRVFAEGDRLVLDVLDDGPGFSPGYQERTGLDNLRTRLDTLYGADASLEVRGFDGGHVRVTLPLRRHTPEGRS